MAKNLSAHQPAYLPWLGYLHKIAVSDEFIILDHVQFEKNSFTNRNRIKTSNGPLWLTVPVHLDGHTNKTISDILIDNTSNWREKHWKSILLNYKKAPFFNQYSSFLEDMYRKDWNDITSLTTYFLTYILDELGIKTKILRQSEISTESKKQELILDLCKRQKADVFIFGELGSNYADRKLFKSQGIEIVFQKFHHQNYSQLWGDFLPNLSCLDCLLNIGPKATYNVIFQKNASKSDIISR